MVTMQMSINVRIDRYGKGSRVPSSSYTVASNLFLKTSCRVLQIGRLLPSSATWLRGFTNVNVGLSCQCHPMATAEREPDCRELLPTLGVGIPKEIANQSVADMFRCWRHLKIPLRVDDLPRQAQDRRAVVYSVRMGVYLEAESWAKRSKVEPNVVLS